MISKEISFSLSLHCTLIVFFWKWFLFVLSTYPMRCHLCRFEKCFSIQTGGGLCNYNHGQKTCYELCFTLIQIHCSKEILLHFILWWRSAVHCSSFFKRLVWSKLSILNCTASFSYVEGPWYSISMTFQLSIYVCEVWCFFRFVPVSLALLFKLIQLEQ